MAKRRDPVERAAAATRDLYDVATWEQRTLLDGISSFIYALLVWGGKGLVVLLALLLLVVQFVAGGLVTAVLDPTFLALVVLSVVPALLLAGYVWYADTTRPQPLGALAITFVLGVLFAMFAAIINGIIVSPLRGVSALLLPAAFFLVVGPVEETVKLAAVRLYAYRGSSFVSVVDGAVYGAVAGLGFATIENLLYISRSLGDTGQVLVLGATGGTAAVRALAGPGHVIYSAFAGYYLGLARFNPEHRGPLVVKGLLIASLIHGTYNTLVGIVPAVGAAFFPALGQYGWFIGFIVIYDGFFGLLLYRKLNRYAETHRAVHGQDTDVTPELTEFDTPVGTAAAASPPPQGRANGGHPDHQDGSRDGERPDRRAGGLDDGHPPRDREGHPQGDGRPNGNDDRPPRDHDRTDGNGGRR